jgi:hypothetical protein
VVGEPSVDGGEKKDIFMDCRGRDATLRLYSNALKSSIDCKCRASFGSFPRSRSCPDRPFLSRLAGLRTFMAHYIADDWIGPVAILTDAALASALEETKRSFAVRPSRPKASRERSYPC